MGREKKMPERLMQSICYRWKFTPEFKSIIAVYKCKIMKIVLLSKYIWGNRIAQKDNSYYSLTGMGIQLKTEEEKKKDRKIAGFTLKSDLRSTRVSLSSAESRSLMTIKSCLCKGGLNGSQRLLKDRLHFSQEAFTLSSSFDKMGD